MSVSVPIYLRLVRCRSLRSAVDQSQYGQHSIRESRVEDSGSDLPPSPQFLFEVHGSYKDMRSPDQVATRPANSRGQNTFTMPQSQVRIVNSVLTGKMRACLRYQIYTHVSLGHIGRASRSSPDKSDAGGVEH